jgi:hypothetical protein
MSHPRPELPHIDTDELLPTERSGLVVYWLREYSGWEYTTAEIAVFVGVTWDGAMMILCKLSRVLPLCQSLKGWSFPAKSNG